MERFSRRPWNDGAAVSALNVGYSDPVCSAMGSPPMGGGTSASQTAAMQAQNALNQNAQIRALVLNNSVEVKQNIFGVVLNNPSTPGNNVINIPFRPVGLVKGFIVKATGTISEIGGADSAIVATNLNIANVFSNITLTDLDNYQRINCAGWLLEILGTAKEGFPHGAALLSAAFDTPVKYGNNFNALTFVAPTSAATGSFTVYYWVPCCYSSSDLRGSIYSGVVNATGFLQLTVNPSPWVNNVTDATLAVMRSNGGTFATPPTISQINIQVYQVYLDQIVRYQTGPQTGAPILPPIDISTQYRLNTTSLTGIAAAQDFPIPFTNFQQFLSLVTLYDQAGTVNPGTDVNYWALAAANTYLPFKLDPITLSWLSRHKIKTDMPLGMYLFDFRQQPVNTNQDGNMQMLLNAVTAAAQSQVMAGFEAFALTATVLGAASLPAG